LRRHGLPLRGQDALLGLHRRLALGLRWLPRQGLLNHRVLQVLRRLLRFRLLFWLRLGGGPRLWLHLLVYLWRRWRRWRWLRLGLRLLVYLWRRGRRWLRLRLRLLFWLRRRWLLCGRLRGRLLRRSLRAGMLRVLTAIGRGVLGNNDGPRRGRGRDAFGGQEPLRHGQRGHRRDRQQGVLSRRSYLQNLRQVPLLGAAAPFDRAHAMNRIGTRLATYYGRTLMPGTTIQ
jgi:hypothetical protein